MVDNHVQALMEKHATLDRLIHEEETRPMPDKIRLSTLKKRKLKLKEELSFH